jgi:hypothetical protein
MTEAQYARIVGLSREGRDGVSLQAIPDGSWLFVKRREGNTWIEVIDPEGSGLLAFDIDNFTGRPS